MSGHTGTDPVAADELEVTIRVNGQDRRGRVEARLLLVDFLRGHLGLTGTHIGCDSTNCGACTVLLDGRSVKSCTMLAVQADGSSVRTVEGLAQAGSLSDLQSSFQEHHGLQCGYCTPGMLISATFLLEHNPEPTEEKVRQAIAGNLCRCTGYAFIVEAIMACARRRRSAADLPQPSPPR